jgi:glutamate synthase (NADPH) large chain
LSPIFTAPTDKHGARLTQRRKLRDQYHALDQALDQTLIALAEGALEDAHPVRLELPIRNVNRTVGTLLGAEVTRRYGAQGLPDDTVHIVLTGSAGQSLGAFLPPGITLELTGDANDYVGKGLSGGRIVVKPPADVLFLPEDNVIAGNTLLYGATSGEVYLRGRVGERFCARNSGALAVTEGVGDHACEYMTAGRVVVLGRTGRNMAAGMSGGIAYVLGLNHANVNTAMVELQCLDQEDLIWLREVIANHAHYTGSTVARSVLSDWPRRSAQFTKIMPTDYQRVLAATRMAKAEGRDVDTAIMEASRG